jgi:hypothetical protein
MTWVKFDRAARAHGKCVKAGNDAAAFWAFAIQWSVANQTDGFLDAELLHTITPVPIAKNEAKRLADVCVASSVRPGGAGLFERADGGYVIHDFGDYQPPADIDEKREWLSRARSDAGHRGGVRSGEARRSKNEAIASSKTQAKHAEPRYGTVVCTTEASSSEASDARATESGYSLARRVWSELWAARYGEPYAYAPDTGPRGDDRVLQRLGALAGTGATMRARVAAYLADAGTAGWLTGQRHPLRLLERDWNKYGQAVTAAPRRAPPRSVPQMTCAEIAEAAGRALAGATTPPAPSKPLPPRGGGKNAPGGNLGALLAGSVKVPE